MSQKLIKTFIDSIPHPEKGQKFYRDSEIKGFGLRVGTTSKVYIAESKINGKTIRVTIGKHGIFTAEQARNQAREVLLKMAKGINPNDEAKEQKARSMTLQNVFQDFLAARKALKHRTIYDYKRIMSTYLADWNSKAIAGITKDMIAKRHAELGKTSKAQANLTMRFLRALFNFAAGQYEDSKGQSLILGNPVKRLSQTRAWYRVQRRQTVIKPHELEPWFQAAMSLKNDGLSQNRETIRDYLLLILLTGLRREEAAGLTWNNIDLKSKTLKVINTKNHLDHTLPLSDFLYDLLQERKTHAINEYVFPKVSGNGYIVEPRKQMAKIIEQSGVTFTIHDLRRTFMTVAESLDISAYAVKRLANHKMNNDITAGYIVADAERLRKPMQKITDYILKCAGYKPTTTTADLPAGTLQNDA
ncbi:tyrosine-type recombinase/integrase [Nitrosomonas aestuarii]|uniref:tyrosine-type recombinase/integrase n=1 Tax=Nitrosomonas aestuarii TaxID=52441 RepID=UPI000D31AF0A|nr:integrase family protein [Nitrosomonas aestuarii]PTN11564.1 site-specific recombinase XerD [Nitrosomonas aestuarii]